MLYITSTTTMPPEI